MSGKGDARRDNFRAFNNGLYFWLKELRELYPNFQKAGKKCPQCEGELYTDPTLWFMSNPPKNKLVCRCGHFEWRNKGES
jgi:hypothetical protein